VTGRDLVIDVPARRSWLLRWRDRCLTLLLWGAWGRPVDALARLAIGPVGSDSGPVWDTFLRDLAGATSATSILVVLLYAWGGYQRLHQKAGLWHDRPR
jgi:hypothetical protein